MSKSKSKSKSKMVLSNQFGPKKNALKVVVVVVEYVVNSVVLVINACVLYTTYGVACDSAMPL